MQGINNVKMAIPDLTQEAGCLAEAVTLFIWIRDDLGTRLSRNNDSLVRSIRNCLQSMKQLLLQYLKQQHGRFTPLTSQLIIDSHLTGVTCVNDNALE
jgi:hypothetical protein